MRRSCEGTGVGQRARAAAIQPLAPCATIVSMAPPATQQSEADRLYALGMEKLESGDLLAASSLIWEAAAHAMETYSNARDWKPENRRFFEDIAAFRRQEMGVEMRDDPLSDGFLSAMMLAENVIERGELWSERSVRAYAKEVATLIEGFRVDPLPK